MQSVCNGYLNEDNGIEYAYSVLSSIENLNQPLIDESIEKKITN